MKHLIQFVLLFLLNTNCFGQNLKGFLINGIFTHGEGQKVYLIKRGEMKFDYEKTVYIDSAVVKDSRFTLKGKVKEPDYYSLLIKDDWKPFVLDNSVLTFTGDANEYLFKSQIYGSKEIQWANELKLGKKHLIPLLNRSADSSMAAESRGDQLSAKKYAVANQAVSKEINEKDSLFILQHPDAFISLYTLRDRVNDFKRGFVKQAFNAFSVNLKNHSLGKELNYQIFEGDRITALNAKAINFSQADTTGSKVSLSDFKGKYVLIDFWASWCGPCRLDNPNLKNAYQKYNSKGFEVLGVSLDNDRTAWIKAIASDQLSWTNVSDLRGWKNDAAQKYLVRAVPANYLLDPAGKIIAKDIKGDFLLRKLSELFSR